MKMMKKMMCACFAVFTLVLCLSQMSVKAEAATVAGGTTGDAMWSLNDEGLLIISGGRYMEDYHYVVPAAPWAQYRSQIKKVVIAEDGPCNIGDAAFADCENLKEVEIKSNVTEIGFGAFRGTSLIRITLPNSVTKIGNSAFQLCQNLKSIELPSGLEEIAGSMFSSCSSLKSVTIPNSVTKIGESAFNCCSNLKTVQLSNNIIEIGAGAFASTAIQEISIPRKITEVSDELFRNCKQLKKIAIPVGVTRIGSRAFADCVALEAVQIPNTVKIIDSGAFIFCRKISKVQIPEGVVKIGNNAFGNCEKISTVILPDSLESIGYMAFTGTNLKEVSFGSKLSSIGELAFMESYALKKFTISNANQTYAVNGGVLYTKDMKTLVIAPPGLNRVVIPDGVTSIQTYAFGNSRTKYVCIPASITRIEDRAFYMDTIVDLCYLGTDAQWNQISIGADNDIVGMGNHDPSLPCVKMSPCKNCGTAVAAREAHNMETVKNVKPTCTEPGHEPYFKCKVCGELFGNMAATAPYDEAVVLIPPKGHSLIEVPYQEPTTDATGNIAYWTCHCGRWFADGQGLEEITNKESVILPKKNILQIEETLVKDAIVNAENSEIVEIPADLMGEAEAATSVKISVEAIKLVVEAEKSMSIETAQATVLLDKVAQEIIVEEAGAQADIVLEVTQVKTEQLNEKQQEAVKERDVQLVISAQILCNETTIHDFKGGTATVQIPFEVPAGEKGDDYKVIYISDDGVIEEIETTYQEGNLVVELAHFSEYAVVKVAPAQSVADGNGWILWTAIAGVAVVTAMCIVIMCKRKLARSK